MIDPAPETAPPAAPAPNAEYPQPPSRSQIEAAGAQNLRRALITAVSYLVFLQIVARVTVESMPVILASTLAALLFTLLYTVLLARGLRTNRSLASIGIPVFVLIAPSVALPALVHVFPDWPIWGTMLPNFRRYQWGLHAVAGIDNLLMITCAVSLGVLISRLVKEFKILLPVAVVLAVVDLYVVFGGGLVTQANQGDPVAQKVMNSLVVQLPTAHPARGASPMKLEVGFADFMFIGLFFSCFMRFHTPARRTFYVLCATLLVTMMLVAFVRNFDVPALVPIAVVVIGMNLDRFHFARDELFALMYASIIVAAILLALVIKSHFSRKHAAAHVSSAMISNSVSPVSSILSR